MACDMGLPSESRPCRGRHPGGGKGVGGPLCWRCLLYDAARMPRKTPRKSPLHRLAPLDAPAEAVERIAGRRALTIAHGDVVILREPLPKVNPRPLSTQPQWQFRVCIQGVRGSSQFFTSFTHAASRAEELATTKRRRLLLVEDDIPTVLADYSKD